MHLTSSPEYAMDDLSYYTDDEFDMIHADEADESNTTNSTTLPIRAAMKEDDFVDLQTSATSGGIILPHTIATQFGMGNIGFPQMRFLSQHTCSPETTPLHLEKADVPMVQRRIIAWPEYVRLMRFNPPAPQVTAVAARCLREKRCVHPVRSTSKEEEYRLRRYAANVEACRSSANKEDLKAYIRSRHRLDLEQAAAAVVSALHQDGMADEAEQLVAELGGVLSTSCMWLSAGDEAGVSSEQVKVSNFAAAVKKRCHQAAERQMVSGSEWTKRHLQDDLGSISSGEASYTLLLPILLRIRRIAPQDRCLIIPQWLFDEAGLSIPPHHTHFLSQYQHLQSQSPQSPIILTGRLHPTHPPDSTSILLSRTSFRTLQRRIFRLFRFWQPTQHLRRSIHKLSGRVLYGTPWIDKAIFSSSSSSRSSSSTARIAYLFFQFQRRSQLRLVGWYGNPTYGIEHHFLEKGEGATYYQNNLAVQSSFEQVLRRIAGVDVEGSVLMSEREEEGNTLGLMDETCLLMKQYVDLYGGGEKENLVFRIGVHGGSGRGPVDEYNLLCDILTQLKERAKDEWILEVPGPVHKFLAKDIMAWDNSWPEDAFANGKVPGWEPWLQARRLV